MATITQNINIVINSTGGRTVVRDIGAIGQAASAAQRPVQLLNRTLSQSQGAAQSFANSMRLVRASLVGLGVGALVAELARMSDEFTTIQNRLKNVTSSTAELNVVTDELFQLANRTRSAFKETADLYSRTALATRELGLSQRETLQFTESLNQAIILSGASTKEANAALIQLSQGLASGTLRGDELRSVLEQLPAVADVIAKGLGVTRGELRELGFQGKITPKQIIDAFKEAAPELAAAFADLSPTIEQALTVLRNNVVGFIGEFNKATGASDALANAILFLANNMETLGRVAGAVALIVGQVLGVRAIGLLITGIRALTVAMAANPLGALLVGLSVIISGLIAFRDEIKLTADGVASFGDFMQASFELIVPVLQSVVDFLRSTFGPTVDTIFKALSEIQFLDVIKAAAFAVDAVIGVFRGGFEGIKAAWSNLPAALGDIIFTSMNGVVALVEGAINKVIQAVNQLTSVTGVELGSVDLGRLENPFQGTQASIGDAFIKGFQDQQKEGVQAFVNQAAGRAEEIGERRRFEEAVAEEERKRALAGLEVKGTDRSKPPRDKAAERDAARFKEIVSDLNKEIELLGLSNQEREIRNVLLTAEDKLNRQLTEAEKEQLTVLAETLQLRREERELLDEIQGPTEEYGRRVGALSRLMERGAITLAQYRDKFRELRLEVLSTARDLESGVERGLLQIEEQFGDVAGVAENALVNSFQAAEDALVSFVTTGKFEIQDLANTILQEFTKLAVRQAITAPLSKLLGGSSGEGGLGGLIGSLFGGGSSNSASGGAAAASSGGGLFSGIGKLFGFANGGEFMVGGSGGTDSQTVAFRATPGERVKVMTPGQAEGSQPIVINYYISTPNAQSFEHSQGQILDKTGATIERARRRNR